MRGHDHESRDVRSVYVGFLFSFILLLFCFLLPASARLHLLTCDGYARLRLALAGVQEINKALTETHLVQFGITSQPLLLLSSFHRGSPFLLAWSSARASRSLTDLALGLPS